MTNETTAITNQQVLADHGDERAEATARAGEDAGDVDDDHPNPFQLSRQRAELARLVRQIQELTLERAKLQRQEGASRELESIERTLEQLRWRLADVARGQATDDLDSAA